MKRLIPVLMVAVLAVAGSVYADTYGTVTLDLSGTGGDTVYMTAPTIGTVDVYTYPYYYTLSNFKADASHPNATLDTTKPYHGFCLSLVTDIYENTNYPGFQVRDLADVITDSPDSPQQTNVLKLFQDYATALTTLNVAGSLESPQANYLSDALTVSLWEVLTEKTQKSPFSVTGGDTYETGFTNGADTVANGWLRGLSTAAAYTGHVYALYDSGVQTQEITLLSSLNTGGPVPEPMAFVRFASLLLVGLPIGAIAIYRRRRRA